MTNVLHFRPKDTPPAAVFAAEMMNGIRDVIAKLDNPSRHDIGLVFQIVAEEMARAGAMLRAWPDGPIGGNQ